MAYQKWIDDEELPQGPRRWHHVALAALLLLIALFGYSNANIARCMMAGIWHPLAINMSRHDALIASGVFALLYLIIVVALLWAWWRGKPMAWLVCGGIYLFLLLQIAEQAVWYFITDHGP